MRAVLHLVKEHSYKVMAEGGESSILVQCFTIQFHNSSGANGGRIQIALFKLGLH